LVDLNEFGEQMQESMLRFADTKGYSSKLAVDCLAKIDTVKANAICDVQVINIGSTWQ
jgi:hypothetical protein